MPQLSDRQRTALNALTARQVEALALATIGKSPRSRFSAPNGSRSNMGGAVNRMVDQLRADGFLDAEGVTWLGIHGVLTHLKRVEARFRDEVQREALLRQPDLNAKADRKAEARAAELRDREERAALRKEQREAAIREKLPQLAAEHGLTLSNEAFREEPFDARLVAFWNAVINADNNL